MDIWVSGSEAAAKRLRNGPEAGQEHTTANRTRPEHGACAVTQILRPLPTPFAMPLAFIAAVNWASASMKRTRKFTGSTLAFISAELNIRVAFLAARSAFFFSFSDSLTRLRFTVPCMTRSLFLSQSFGGKTTVTGKIEGTIRRDLQRNENGGEAAGRRTNSSDEPVFFHNDRGVASGGAIAEVRITRARPLAFSRVSIIAPLPAREYRCPTFR